MTDHELTLNVEQCDSRSVTRLQLIGTCSCLGWALSVQIPVPTVANVQHLQAGAAADHAQHVAAALSGAVQPPVMPS